jgi:hypothetical protein
MRGTKFALAAGVARFGRPGAGQGFPDLGHMGTAIGAGGVQIAAMNNVIASSITAKRALPAKAVPRAEATATGYRASPQVAQRVRSQFADWIAARANADAGRQVVTAMKGTDPVCDWSKIVGADGLPPADAAVARLRSEMGGDLRQLRLTRNGFAKSRASVDPRDQYRRNSPASRPCTRT